MPVRVQGLRHAGAEVAQADHDVAFHEDGLRGKRVPSADHHVLVRVAEPRPAVRRAQRDGGAKVSGPTRPRNIRRIDHPLPSGREGRRDAHGEAHGIERARRLEHVGQERPPPPPPVGRTLGGREHEDASGDQRRRPPRTARPPAAWSPPAPSAPRAARSRGPRKRVQASSPMSAKVVVLIPPAVEPGEPPTTISRTVRKLVLSPVRVVDAVEAGRARGDAHEERVAPAAPSRAAPRARRATRRGRRAPSRPAIRTPWSPAPGGSAARGGSGGRPAGRRRRR